MHGRWAWSQLNREWRVCDWRAEKQAVQDKGCKAGSTLKRALQTPRQGVSFTAKWSGKLQVYKQRSALIYDLKTVICLLHGKRNMGGEQNGWASLYQEYDNWDLNSEAAQRSSARTVEEKQSCNHFSLLRSTSLTPTKSCALCLTDSFLSKALGLLMGSYPRGGYWNSSDTKTFDRLVPRALQTLQSHWSMIWVVYLALCLHIRRIQVWEKQA